MRIGCSGALVAYLIVLFCRDIFQFGPVFVNCEEVVGTATLNADGKVVERSCVVCAANPDQQLPEKDSISLLKDRALSEVKARVHVTTPSALQHNIGIYHSPIRLLTIAGNRPSTHFTTLMRLSGGADDESNTSKVDEIKGSRSGAFLGNIDTLRRRSLKLPRTIIQSKDPILQRMKSAAEMMHQTGSRAIPSAMTTLTVLYAADGGISAASLYALALLGASCGFHLFLYFITIGYSLGIGFPLLVSLYVYNKHTELPRATFLHSFVTLIWSVRMLAFYVYREYVSWPALHEKVVEIQNRMTIPFASRLLCWIVYSFFYFAMMSMLWGRLHQGATAKWGTVGVIGLLIQGGGLTLETIADLQKNGFKSRKRHSWCNVGVWKWSSHPNYLGEATFWIGTYLGHGFYSIPRTLLATVGLVFILQVLRGSTKSLAKKHVEKYGDQPDFFEFHRTHSIWGPKQWWWWLNGMDDSSNAAILAVEVIGNTTSTENVTTTFRANETVIEDPSLQESAQ